MTGTDVPFSGGSWRDASERRKRASDALKGFGKETDDPLGRLALADRVLATLPEPSAVERRHVEQHAHTSNWDDELVYAHVRALPAPVLMALRQGPIASDTACRVCEVLRYPEYPNEKIGFESQRWLLDWHGIDPVRCGAVYGMAHAALDAKAAEQREEAQQGAWKGILRRAEQRHVEQQAEIERLRARVHEVAQQKDQEHREQAKAFGQLQWAVKLAQERTRDWTPNASAVRGMGWGEYPGSWWAMSSLHSCMDVVALIADRDRAEQQQAKLTEERDTAQHVTRKYGEQLWEAEGERGKLEQQQAKLREENDRLTGAAKQFERERDENKELRTWLLRTVGSASTLASAKRVVEDLVRATLTATTEEQ
jgi:hypothetical protein